MSEFYNASEELIDIANDLIENYHGHLIEAKIKYLFRTGNWETKKRETWGQAKKIGKEVNFLTGYDFLITIHKDVWEQLNKSEREALLDHELQHCFAGTDKAGNKIWGVEGHDVEDFYAVIRRHGLWSKPLKKLEQTLNQIELKFEVQDDSDGLLELPGQNYEAIEGREYPQLTSNSPKQLQEPQQDDIEVETDFDDVGPSIVVTDAEFIEGVEHVN